MISARMRFLLLEAAQCFADLRSPFEHDWLSEHEVTCDECGYLSETIGMILRGYANAHKNAQAEVMLNSSEFNPNLIHDVMSQINSTERMRKVFEQLNEAKPC